VDVRAALLATLMEATFAAAGAGDADTARIAHDAAGKMLATLDGPAFAAARVAHDAAGKMRALIPEVPHALPTFQRRTRARRRPY
jgi:hypothetical protein